MDSRSSLGTRRRVRHRVVGTPVLAAALLALAGCHADNQVAEEPVEGPFAIILESAREEGASATQLEILARSNATGAVSLADLKAATDATFECFADAGIDYASQTSEGPNPEISYQFSAPEGGSSIADECISRNSMFVEWAYQTQPSVQELVDAAFNNKRDQIMTCLRGMGIEIDDDANVDEIKRAASITAEEYESRWKFEARLPMDCVSDAGITNW